MKDADLKFGVHGAWVPAVVHADGVSWLGTSVGEAMPRRVVEITMHAFEEDDDYYRTLTRSIREPHKIAIRLIAESLEKNNEITR